MEEIDHKQIALALAVGMGAAAEVARQAGHIEAARCIQQYRTKWEAEVNPAKQREMVRADIMPADAARFATASDFWIAG